MSVEEKDTGFAHVFDSTRNLLRLPNAEFTSRAEHFIDQRLRHLQERAVPCTLSAISPPYQGFIHQDSEVRPLPQGVGFRLDDPTIYAILLQRMRRFSPQVQFGSGDPDERQYRRLAYSAVQDTQHIYFDLEDDKPPAEADRHRMIWRGALIDEDPPDHPYSIADFKGIADCTERAAVANNLATFLGLAVKFVNGELKVDNKELETHTFLTTENSKGEGLIYDPTNPELVYDESGTVRGLTPAIYPDSGDVLSGGSTSHSYQLCG